MIFVTVGTHEQQFNRLVEFVDRLKENGTITEEVIIQTGFSDYEPRYCKWSKLFSYTEMKKMTEEARIVITHGGPSSFIAPLQIGKVPIVVPRKYDFLEHVNNHQVMFCKAVEEKERNIIVVDEIEKLTEIIINYDEIIGKMKAEIKSNNANFCKEFGKIVDRILN